MKLYRERPVLTSNLMSVNYNRTSKCKTDSFGPLGQLWSVTLKCMRDNEPQCCIQPHKSIKVTRNATNRDKASKQIFANNLFTISCKYMQSMLSNWKICFNVFNIRTDDEDLCNLSKLSEIGKERPTLTSQFDVSKLEKQVRSVTLIRLNQCANFGPLPLNVCVTVSHNVAFNSINRQI